MSGPTFEIGEYSPWRRRALTLLVLLVVVATGWGGYEYGRYSAGFDARDARERNRQQQARIDALENERRRLQTERLSALRGAEVDRDANVSVRAALAKSQQELLELSEELAFYRSIVSPGEVSDGLQVQRLRVTPSDAEGYYAYELVLTQAQQQRRSASGSVDLRVSGIYRGESITYAFSDVAEGDVDKLNFKFRYFQSFEGSLRLPAAFDPQSVTILVQPDGKQAKTLREFYQWSDILSGGS